MRIPALVRVNRKGRVLESWERVGNRKLRTPNFSVFDAEGNLYSSDSGDFDQVNGWVYRISKNGRAEVFAGPFAFANGLALSADERFLYVVQSTCDNVGEGRDFSPTAVRESAKLTLPDCIACRMARRARCKRQSARDLLRFGQSLQGQACRQGFTARL